MSFMNQVLEQVVTCKLYVQSPFLPNVYQSELFSGVREVGYYGKSQTFSIGTSTNSLSLGITLQSTGTTSGDISWFLLVCFVESLIRHCPQTQICKR